MSSSTKKVPAFRIAFRNEGDFVNAYLAQPGTMDGALLVGSIRRTALRVAGALDAYQALMRMVFRQMSIDCGFGDPGEDGWIVGPAPENERTGLA